MAMAVAEELEESARRAAREWREKGGLPAESGEANAESWQDVAARNSEVDTSPAAISISAFLDSQQTRDVFHEN